MHYGNSVKNKLFKLTIVYALYNRKNAEIPFKFARQYRTLLEISSKFGHWIIRRVTTTWSFRLRHGNGRNRMYTEVKKTDIVAFSQSIYKHIYI